MAYTLGSLFDGSGGFPLAGTMCGFEPRWAAEVEPYPIAVTRSRFPSMKHFGDVSKINGAEIEPVDVITFGSPCQDLSVAGKRAGLKHEANGDEETTRSGLFMEAVRIIKEMREATDGKYPSFALWENVPGAFSSNKGEDFRIVCEELIKIVEPNAVMPSVPTNGWAYADSYVGDGWSLSYRVFDAQYWGVPQRRRRIHLIVDFRGERAHEVLFEREGLRGHFAEGRTPWQEIATDAERSTGADDREGTENCLDAKLYQPMSLREENWAESETRNALRAGESKVSHSIVQPEPIPINTLSISHGSGGDLRRGDGIGAPGSPQFSISCSHPHAVVYCDRASFNQGQNAKYDPQFLTDGTAATLIARGPGAVTYCTDAGQLNSCEGQRPAQLARQCEDPNPITYGKPRGYIARRLTPTECARLQGFPDKWGHIEPKETLTAEEYSFWLDVRNTHAAINSKTVKGYSNQQILAWYNKLWTDGAEYKMWGNGIALPPALYCMQGIVIALDKYIRETEAEDDDSWML